jgi:hypothetical protein
MLEVYAPAPSSVWLIYTRGQVTCDTSHPAVAPAIDIPLVGQDTKPRLRERADHVVRYSEQVLNSETLGSAAVCVFRPGVSTVSVPLSRAQKTRV